MHVFMKKMTTSYGTDSAMIIEYESETELNDFIEICSECRKQAVLLMQESERFSNLDAFLNLLVSRKKGFMKFNEKREVQTSIIFSREFPLLFYSLFEAVGLYVCLFEDYDMLNENLGMQEQIIGLQTKHNEALEKQKENLSRTVNVLKQMLSNFGVGMDGYDSFSVDREVSVAPRRAVEENDIAVGVAEE